MKTYQQTSDSSGFYRDRTGDFGHRSAGSADCGATVDTTKNNIFPASVVYVSAPMQASEVIVQTNATIPPES